MFSLKQDDENDTFRVKRTIGTSYNTDEDDVRRTKSALHATGDYKPPKWGMTGVTDDGMFDGLKKFQKREGLQVDGIMRPGGPTEKKLRERTSAAKSADAPGRSSSAPAGKTDILGNPLPQPKKPDAVSERPSLGDLDIDLGLPKRTGQDRDRSQESQVAALPLFNLLAQAANRIGPAIVRSFPSAAALADKAGKEAAKRGQSDDADNPPAIPPIPEEWLKRDAPQQRQQADPPPPTPGFEPPDFEMPDRTESPSEPVELPDLSEPLPEVKEPTIFIFPIPDSREFGNGILERKGNEETREELEEVRDYFEEVKGWEHIAGGRFSHRHKRVISGEKKSGDEQAEYHVAGHFGSLKGGRFSDLTFDAGNGRIVHVQTVDVDKNGKTKQRELDAAEAILWATGHSVLLIPKGAQLKRLANRQKRRRRN